MDLASDLAAYNRCKVAFQAQDADIELQSAPDTCCATDTDITTPTFSFKAHIQKLAAVSPVFADMLAVSDASTVDDDSKAVELQKVRLEETWMAIYILLGYAYNMEGIIGGLMKTTDPFLALEV